MVTDHHLGGIKIRSVGKLYTIRLGAKESFQYLCDKLGPWISCQRAQLHKCVCVAHYIMLTFTTCTIATIWIRYWLPSVVTLGCCCWPYILLIKLSCPLVFIFWLFYTLLAGYLGASLTFHAPASFFLLQLDKNAQCETNNYGMIVEWLVYFWCRKTRNLKS